jgi:hypothetical protein
MLIDDFYFHLSLCPESCSLENSDPSHYAYSTHGSVIAADAQGNETVAGKFHVYYLDVCAALDAGESVSDIFDCRSSTVDYFSAIFASDSLDISEELQKLLKYDAGWGNVLILNRLEILPVFRRRNLGLLVMRRLIERFGAGAAWVAIKPFPLQRECHSHDDDEWRAKLQLSGLEKDARRATAKLRQYYKQLGFKAMKGTPFMFLSTEEPLPAPDALWK